MTYLYMSMRRDRRWKVPSISIGCGVFAALAVSRRRPRSWARSNSIGNLSIGFSNGNGNGNSCTNLNVASNKPIHGRFLCFDACKITSSQSVLDG